MPNTSSEHQSMFITIITVRSILCQYTGPADEVFLSTGASAYHYRVVPDIIITSREVHEARPSHTCSRPCAFEEKKRKKTGNPRGFFNSGAYKKTKRKKKSST